ncbi:MAG: cytochrome c biogenesis protein ResB, partial [Hylemonella sp.]|nr:cytochrome c biogenesis protein ResB [Hylemonella sp.]
MQAATRPFEVEGVIGSSAQLSNGNEKLTLEYTGLRVINVENFADAGGSGVDVRKVDLRTSINERLGAANKADAKKTQRNVGPSVTYKLRDAAGQAQEFHNYMLPVDLGDGRPVFLLGVRETQSEPFRYLRVPADDQGSSDEFFRLRTALADAELRDQAIRRYAARMIDPSRRELLPQLVASAARAVGLFAGVETVRGSQAPGGLQAVADFLEVQVPEAERSRAGEMLIRILNGVLHELLQLERAQAGLPPLAIDEKTQAFMSQAVLALSDAFFYPAPMVLALEDFKQVQASVFQVARAPGKTIVYLGCALLILGVFAMLYVRERRLWVWLVPQAGGSQATLALSTNRRTLDTDREFERLSAVLMDARSEK